MSVRSECAMCRKRLTNFQPKIDTGLQSKIKKESPVEFEEAKQ